jgi:hypothetical protein
MLKEDDEGKRNLVELAEFAYVFSTVTDAALEQLFPDLINSELDKSAAISMYRRFAQEAQTVLRKYSGPTKLLGPRIPRQSTRSKKGAAR